MSTNPSTISFVASSKRRLEILKILTKERKSQPEIANLTGMYKAHVSRTLKELLEKELVVCQNPEDRAFKFYSITSLGKKVITEATRILSATNN
jgi:predicted transcriptional regulator